MNNMVLRPLQLKELREFFDDKAIEILRFQLEKSIIAQPERKENQKGKALQITKEYLEQWCVQAIKGVEPKGAGNYPIDILKVENWGADIKALACSLDKQGNLKLGDSGEASLGQNFKSAGKTLDNLFIAKKYEEIKNKWIKVLNEKYDKVKKELKIQKFYFFFFLRAKTKFYLCGAYIETNNFSKLVVDELRTTEDSVYLKNFIDKELGNTKIYKAKKRLELRLTPKNWVDKGLCLELPIPNYLPATNLREKDLDLYREEIFNFNKNNGNRNLELELKNLNYYPHKFSKKLETGYSIYFNDIKIYQNESLNPKTAFYPVQDIKIEHCDNYLSIYREGILILLLKINENFKLKRSCKIVIHEDIKEFLINIFTLQTFEDLSCSDHNFLLCISKKIIL